MKNIVYFVILAFSITVVSSQAITYRMGDVAPDLDRPTIISAGGDYGSNIDIHDLIGDVVVVNFWKST